jgi:hypothetical protein
MGDFDSSRTRVAPFFNRLCERDWTGRQWLGPLLRLPQLPGVSRSVVEVASPVLRDCGWGEGEKRLPAPRSLLEWLIRNLDPPRREEDLGTGEVRAKREALLRQDPAVIRQALERLATPDRPDRAWWVFEGPSRPDAYLETDNEIIVIEGKRTEPTATTYTTWMAVRHQMLRHLDAAWDLRRGRRVYGFFMVEGDGGETGVEVPAKWVEAARATVSPDALESSLPHRSPAERGAIADGFLGVTTWQAACRALGVPWEALPDRI